MPRFASQKDLLRDEPGEHGHRVSFVELFFDLVFVFAVTQISHTLVEDLSAANALRMTLLLLAVWWVWIYTSWVTNWLDPEHAEVRLMLFALMLAGLVLSASLPKAFSERGLTFACAYVAMQLGRTLFMLWALWRHNEGNFRNFQRIFAWLALSGLFWIAGGFAEHNWRAALWVCALLIEIVSPALGFWTPGLGRSNTADWNIEGNHLAERCGLFIIIALGESILVTGATFAKLEWSAGTVGAALVALVGSVAMWWVYFNIGAEAGSKEIAKSDDPGRLARAAYTYLHVPIVAGIVLSAVADELILAHPGGHTELKTAATAVGGPALFIFGNILFKNATTRRWPLSHLVGLGALALVAPLAAIFPPLAIGALASGALVLVAVWETISLGPRHKALGEAEA